MEICIPFVNQGNENLLCLTIFSSKGKASSKASDRLLNIASGFTGVLGKGISIDIFCFGILWCYLG